MKVSAVVFDVLGTLVDQPAGVTAALVSAHQLDARSTDEASRVWFGAITDAQRAIVDGRCPYEPNGVLDRNAVDRVSPHLARKLSPGDAERLLLDSYALTAWPDSARGLEALAQNHAVVGLSNASPSALLRISEQNGLRWHQLVSAEETRSYKPAASVYELAVEVTGRPAEECLMVAAHAWDLRGAAAIGMRTAYVQRPVGDPPLTGDSFDFTATSLLGLLGEL